MRRQRAVRLFDSTAGYVCGVTLSGREADKLVKMMQVPQHTGLVAGYLYTGILPEVIAREWILKRCHCYVRYFMSDISPDFFPVLRLFGRESELSGVLTVTVVAHWQ